MASLRGQLTLWLAALFTGIGILGSATIAYLAYLEQSRLLDDQLKQVALSVGDTPSAAGKGSRAIAGISRDDRLTVQILDSKGGLIRNSDPSASIPVMQATGFSEHMDGDVLWRTFTLVTEQRIIQVSQDTDVRSDTVRDAALNLLLPVGVLIPLSWLVVGLVVRRRLSPLQELSEGLRESSGGERVKLPAELLPIELRPLATAANQLLDRQHELLRFREDFISDAAHQLRTPVTGLKLQLQNLKQELSLPASASLRELETGLARLSGLIGQLLNLARAESPSASHEHARIGECVRAALAGAVAFADARGIDLGLVQEADGEVEGAAVDITMLTANLIDNAVRYTPKGGSVDVRIARDEQSCFTVSVCDTGPGIAEADLPLVFERFHRGSRSEGEGNGLGLAIVAALARRLGARVDLANRATGGLEARVRFVAKA